MVEIIKHGKFYVKFTKECHFCGCKFSFTESDITVGHSTNKKCSVPDYIRCPECRQVITLNNRTRNEMEA